jgi:hypothetical protein
MIAITVFISYFTIMQSHILHKKNDVYHDWAHIQIQKKLSRKN